MQVTNLLLDVVHVLQNRRGMLGTTAGGDLRLPQAMRPARLERPLGLLQLHVRESLKPAAVCDPMLVAIC